MRYGPVTKRKSVYICAWMEPEEKEEIIALAKQTHLSVSELIRRLVTGQKLPDARHHEAVLNLMKINADLARLGNLFKMAIDDDQPDKDGLEAMRNTIRDTQFLLKTRIGEL